VNGLFTNKIKCKFGLSDGAQLSIFGESHIVVEDGILLELVEANPDLCLTVQDKDQSGESSSLTNTLSRSSEGDSRVEWGIPISGERTALTCPTSNSEVIGSCKE
ncbi:uncharacterized protein DAT39_016352, partial [Clarias magur]